MVVCVFTLIFRVASISSVLGHLADGRINFQQILTTNICVQNGRFSERFEVFQNASQNALYCHTVCQAFLEIHKHLAFSLTLASAEGDDKAINVRMWPVFCGNYVLSQSKWERALSKASRISKLGEFVV